METPPVEINIRIDNTICKYDHCKMLWTQDFLPCNQAIDIIGQLMRGMSGDSGGGQGGTRRQVPLEGEEKKG